VTATIESGKTTKRRRWERGRYVHRRKVCAFCADASKVIDYKEPKKLRGFISDRGKIEPRRKTGTCAKHQRILSLAIKRARHLALLPFVPEHVYRTGGVGIQEGLT
jgi:small subunit ribosomal protein S18